MHVMHEKDLLEPSFPFRLFIINASQFPPHWHEEIEVVYVLEGEVRVVLNSRLYVLKKSDILLIGGGDIHHFLTQQKNNKVAIIQFGLSIFENFPISSIDKRFTRLLAGNSTDGDVPVDVQVHRELEQHIVAFIDEYTKKQQGYQLALKARVFDIGVILLRKVPMENYVLQEKVKRLNKLERLENVFAYVEKNYEVNVTLSEISKVANFSVYHFVRFFKDTVGMTFGQYLNDFRIKKAKVCLLTSSEPITQVAFKTGFNSVTTFNRLFKELQGCSPSEFRKSKN